MALTNIAASANATIMIPNTGYALYVRTNGAGSATFAGAPASFTANTPVRMVYDHASLKWYPA